MCNKIVKFSLLTIFLLSSCVAQQARKPTGILTGTIGIYEGNCMPGPGVEPCVPRPISTTVLITRLTENFEKDLVVKETKSKEDGSYSIELPEGTYSLFVKDGDKAVCTFVQCPSVCYCNPFQIVADSTTVIDAELDHATW